jgi:hypothetical protein
MMSGGTPPKEDPPMITLNDYLDCFFRQTGASVLDPVYGEGVVQGLARKKGWYDENWVGTSGASETIKERRRKVFSRVFRGISREGMGTDQKEPITAVILDRCQTAADRCYLPDYVEQMKQLLIAEDDESASFGSVSDDEGTGQTRTARTGFAVGVDEELAFSQGVSLWPVRQSEQEQQRIIGEPVGVTFMVTSYSRMEAVSRSCHHRCSYVSSRRLRVPPMTR